MLKKKKSYSRDSELTGLFGISLVTSFAPLNSGSLQVFLLSRKKEHDGEAAANGLGTFIIMQS